MLFTIAHNQRQPSKSFVLTPISIIIHNLDCRIYCITVKPRFTAVFGGKEISAVNRGPQ